MVDIMLYVFYIIFAVALLLALGFAVKSIKDDPKNAGKGLLATAAVLVVFVLAWVFTKGEEVLSATGETLATAGQSHLVSAGLIIFYIMLFATVVAALYATVTSALKK